MNIGKVFRPSVLRNILFSLVGLMIISMIISTTIISIIDNKVNEKQAAMWESFDKIGSELEFNGMNDKIKEYADKYNKLFNEYSNNYSNIIVTDEAGNIVYNSNSGFIPEKGKFQVIASPLNGNEENYYDPSTAYILDSKNKIKYAAALNLSYNTDKLREISASNPLAKILFSQNPDLNNYGQRIVKNVDGTSYSISDDLNISLTYTYICSKGLNLYSAYNSKDVQISAYREYRSLRSISNNLFGGNGAFPICAIVFILFWLLLPVWVFMDARKREFRAPLWAILALAANVVGLIVYLVVRPEYPKCINCGEQLNNRFIVCPYCGTKNKELCPSCGQVIEEDWVACPYCGHMEKSCTNAQNVTIDALQQDERQ